MKAAIAAKFRAWRERITSTPIRMRTLRDGGLLVVSPDRLYVAPAVGDDYEVVLGRDATNGNPGFWRECPHGTREPHWLGGYPSVRAARRELRNLAETMIVPQTHGRRWPWFVAAAVSILLIAHRVAGPGLTVPAIAAMPTPIAPSVATNSMSGSTPVGGTCN